MHTTYTFISTPVTHIANPKRYSKRYGLSQRMKLRRSERHLFPHPVDVESRMFHSGSRDNVNDRGRGFYDAETCLLRAHVRAHPAWMHCESDDAVLLLVAGQCSCVEIHSGLKDVGILARTATKAFLIKLG